MTAAVQNMKKMAIHLDRLEKWGSPLLSPIFTNTKTKKKEKPNVMKMTGFLDKLKRPLRVLFLILHMEPRGVELPLSLKFFINFDD